MKPMTCLLFLLLVVACGSSEQRNGLLAVATESNGDWDLSIVNLDNKLVQTLTDNRVFDFEPVWSPDGSQIAYTSEYVTGEERVIMEPGANGETVERVEEIAGDRDILILSDDGSHLRRLGLSGVTDDQPAWSPDGDQIAFVSDRSGDVDIWVMDSYGENATQLTSSPLEDWMPAWSPDGTRIAYSSKRSGIWEIFIVDSDGSNVTPISATDAQADNWGPVWSPDGNQIAFASMQSGNWDIFLTTVGSGHFEQLTSQPGTDFEPVWSPDGKRIAFASDRRGKMEVHLMLADGTGIEPTGVLGLPSDWTASP